MRTRIFVCAGHTGMAALEALSILTMPAGPSYDVCVQPAASCAVVSGYLLLAIILRCVLLLLRLAATVGTLRAGVV